MSIEALQNENSNDSLTPFYISFSDLMVLLCTFFLMLLSMSKLDIGSFEQIRTGVTGKTEGTLVELHSKLQDMAKDMPEVSVHMTPDGVRLDLQTAALFDVASAKLKENRLKSLDPILKEIKSSKYTIDVEGHTDDQPMYRRQGDMIETNWSLSGRRASSVVHYLLAKGFAQRRLRIVGYAANKPKTPYKNLEGGDLVKARSTNRRVSILVK